VKYLLRNKMLQITAFLSLLLVCGPFLHAQASAISGTVTDTSGASIAGAKVVVTNQGTGISRTVTTDSSGFYSAEGLAVGQYKIDVTKEGFQASITNGIQIDPGQRRANNVKLEVGGATSEVTVTANAEQVNTESSESGGTISSKQIDNLMLNGRNFQTLAIAIPGVSSTNAADALGGGGLEGGTTLIVNGNSVEYTTYTIDGVYNMNSGNLANINILPVVDGIAEFSVLKDSYSAKYGFAGSGQVVVETKSGTDAFHGSAWDYLRNNAFDAEKYFSTSTLALHQNIYGYTLGGPVTIPKLYNTNGTRKTFFFASNQWQAISAGSVIRAAVFPQAMRNGDFSASPTLGAGLSLDAHSQALLASEGKTNCVTNSTTLNPSCFDPVAVGLLNAYVPLPNDVVPGQFQNYINQDPTVTSQLDYQFRVDHQINKNNQVIGRIMYEPVLNSFPDDAWSGTPFNTVTDAYYTTSFNGLLRVQSQITPNLMNTASVAETDDRPHILLRTGSGTLPAGLSIIQSFPTAPTLNRIPNISISEGWAGNGVGSQPISASDGEGLVTDDVSWIRGRHVLQAGALYMFGIKRQTVFTNPQGSFSFSGAHTGDPAADYMLGLDASYSQASSEREGVFHYRQGEAYVQDDWKVTPRLTLNLGLRWVYFSNDSASGDQLTSFNPTLFDPTQAPVVTPTGAFQVNSANQPLTSSGAPANLLNGLAFAGQNGVPDGFFIPKKTNFGPRVGFAYDLSGNGTTSIRGGYGIGYSRIPVAVIYYAFGQNPPYNQSANITNSLLSNGTAGGVAVAPTPENLNAVPFDFTPTQLQSYSLTLEHQLKSNMVAVLAYAGSQTRHLTTGVGGGNDINWPLQVTAPSIPTSSTNNCLGGQAPSNSYDFDPCLNTGVSSSNYTRPYQGYSTINDQYDEGSANYNALQSSVNYRAGASQFSVAYTYSKALATVAGHGSGSTTSQGAGPQNPRDWAAEYGPPAYDFTNDITATWVYAIPYFSHSSKPVALALGNWSLGGLFLHQSGFATSPGLSSTTQGLAARPNQVTPYRKLGKLNEWFDTDPTTGVFQAPAYGFYGDAKNGTIRGPAYTSFNVSLYKTFPIYNRLAMQVRAEAFNVLNHPNFNSVDTALRDGSYGQVTNTGDPRIMEFAAKMTF
jgi:Carboxypeptidase regulatory-like domain/TonB-dependent Receptor Plug Domain